MVNLYQLLLSKTQLPSAILEASGFISHANSEFMVVSQMNPGTSYHINHLLNIDWDTLYSELMTKPTLISQGRLNHHIQTYQLQFEYFEQDAGANRILLSLKTIEAIDLKTELSHIEQRFKALFDNSFDCIAYFNMNSFCEMANKAFCDLIGYTLTEIQALEYTTYTPPGWEDIDQKISHQIKTQSSTDIFEKEYIHKDGHIISVSMRATGVWNHQGKLIGTWFIFRDIGEHQKQLRALKHQQQLLEQMGRLAGVGGWEYQEHSETIHFTPESMKLLGLPLNYPGKLFDTLTLFTEDSRYELQASVEVSFLLNAPFNIEVEYLGFKQPRLLKLTGRVKKEGSQKYLVGAIQDISAFKKKTTMKKDIRASGFNTEVRTLHDSLTGLANQSLLYSKLKRRLRENSKTTYPMFFLELDLLHFRRINENAGYSAGDTCLIKLSKRMQKRLNKGDVLARIGGDEFAIIIENYSREAVEVLGQKLLKSIEKPLKFKNQSFFLKTVISAVEINKGDEITDIYRKAERGIEQLKSNLDIDQSRFIIVS